MLAREFVELLKSKDVEAGALDDLVQEVASIVASNVNNKGMSGQIEWLLSNGVSSDNIMEEVGLL